MSPPNETTPETNRESFQRTLERAAGPNDTSRPRQPHRTQYDRVISALMEHDEVCGHRMFYGSMMIPRFSAHLTRARKAGYVITKRPCDLADHDHEGTGWLYRLEALPHDPMDGAA